MHKRTLGVRKSNAYILRGVRPNENENRSSREPLRLEIRHQRQSQKLGVNSQDNLTPPRVLRARCNLPISILTAVRIVLTGVRVVATNWSLERPLEVPERDQTCSSSGATVAATFILFPLKRRS